MLDSKSEFISKLWVNKTDRSYQIWQRNPLSIQLYSREVIEQKLDYIHQNPINGKWKLCDDYLDYKYSSVRFYELNDEGRIPLTHYMDDI